MTDKMDSAKMREKLGNGFYVWQRQKECLFSEFQENKSSVGFFIKMDLPKKVFKKLFP